MVVYKNVCGLLNNGSLLKPITISNCFFEKLEKAKCFR